MTHDHYEPAIEGLPRDKTYYSVTPTGQAYLNTPDDPRPIQIRA